MAGVMVFSTVGPFTCVEFFDVDTFAKERVAAFSPVWGMTLTLSTEMINASQ